MLAKPLTKWVTVTMCEHSNHSLCASCNLSNGLMQTHLKMPMYNLQTTDMKGRWSFEHIALDVLVTSELTVNYRQQTPVTHCSLTVHLIYLTVNMLFVCSFKSQYTVD